MGKRLYIGNLNFATSKDDLRATFDADGRNVTDVHFVTDRKTGRSRGFAFVELASDEDARSAIEGLDGTEWMERKIQVGEARERTTSGGRGGACGGAGRW